MKTTMRLLTTLACTLYVGYAGAQCQGDCNNGYGTLVAGKTTTTGFFKNSKLEGPGDVYGESLYSGQWKNGRKEGLGVYKELNGEGITYGIFADDKKQGLHITLLSDGSIMTTTFDKGILKEKKTVAKNTDAACPYGNCQNGAGVKLESLPDGNTMTYTGKFVNGVLEGPGYVLYSGSPHRIYGTYKAGITDGFMVTMYADGGVALAEMKAGQRHGRLVNIFSDGKSAAYYFENDKPVSK